MALKYNDEDLKSPDEKYKDHTRIYVKDRRTNTLHPVWVPKEFKELPLRQRELIVDKYYRPKIMDLADKDETWLEYGKGLGSNFLRGLSLGLTDLNEDLSESSHYFENKHPVAATVADVAGSVAPLALSVLGAPFTGGSSLGAAGAATAGRLAAKTGIKGLKDLARKGASLAPTTLVDNAVRKAIYGKGKKYGLGRVVATGGLGTGLYTANSNYHVNKDDPHKKSYTQNFKDGFFTGALLSPITYATVGGAGLAGQKLYNAIKPKSSNSEGALKYLEKKLNRVDTSLEDVVTSLKDTNPKYGRLYDSTDHLKNNRYFKELTNDEKNYALFRKELEDDYGRLLSEFERKGGVLDRHLGSSPKNYTYRTKNKMKQLRKENSEPLYDKFNNSLHDLSDNPRLLQNLTQTSNAKDVLRQAYGSADDLGFNAEVNYFKNNLNKVKKILGKNKEDAVELLRSGAPQQEIDQLFKTAIKEGDLDLKVPGRVLDAIEKSESNRVASLEDLAKKLGVKDTSAEASNSLSLKRNYSESFPQYKEAQEKYKHYSDYVNIADLIQNNLTKNTSRVNDYVEKLLLDNPRKKHYGHKVSRDTIDNFIEGLRHTNAEKSRSKIIKNRLAGDNNILNKLESTIPGFNKDSFVKDVNSLSSLLETRNNLLSPNKIPTSSQNLPDELKDISLTVLMSLPKKAAAYYKKINQYLTTKSTNKDVINLLNKRPGEAIELINKYLRDAKYRNLTEEQLIGIISRDLEGRLLSDKKKD